MSYGPEEKPLDSRAIKFGDFSQTNNKSDVHIIRSIVGVLCTLYAMGQLLVTLVIVRGNSKTLIKFMICDIKVRKAELVAMVWEVQELAKKIKGIRVLF